MEVSLNKGMFAEIDSADYALVSGRTWYAARHRHTFYAHAKAYINGKWTTIKMHRVILDAILGQQVDHDNGNGLDNRRSNIKICSHAYNQHNQHAVRSKSGFMGVCRTPFGTWQVQIKRNGRSIAVGTFTKITDAVLARELFSIAWDAVFPA